MSQDDIHRAGGALPAGPVQQASHPPILLVRRVLIGTSPVPRRATRPAIRTPAMSTTRPSTLIAPGGQGCGTGIPARSTSPRRVWRYPLRSGSWLPGTKTSGAPVRSAIQPSRSNGTSPQPATRSGWYCLTSGAREVLGHLVGDGQDPHLANLPSTWGHHLGAVLYDVLVAVHVVSAVVGFGAVALSGVYGATARHADRPEAQEETARYFRSPGRAEWLIVPVPFLGAAALGARPEGADFGAVSRW